MSDTIFELAAKKRDARFRDQEYDKLPMLTATTDLNTKPRVANLLFGRKKRSARFVCLAFCVLGTYTIASHLRNTSSHIIETSSSTLSQKYGSIASSIAGSFEAITNTQTSEEIASLMTEFYELLAKMGYYNPSMIQHPTHSPGINVSLAQKLGYSQKSIQLMQMLPYLGIDHGDNNPAWGEEFVFNGRFADLRNDEELSACRDPFYLLNGDEEQKGPKWDDPGGRYMKPDYICLSAPRDWGPVMILDVKNYKLWAVDQEEWTSSDPMLRHKDKVVSKNENSLDNVASRPARYALQLFMQKFIKLEWMPSRWPGTYEGDNYARMYIENGWPDNFNLSAFNTSRLEWEEYDDNRYHIEEPFREVIKLENWLKSGYKQEQEYLNTLSDIDTGSELLDGSLSNSDGIPVSRATYRHNIVKKLEGTRERTSIFEEQLFAARNAVELLDPTIARLRDERMAKYGAMSE